MENRTAELKDRALDRKAWKQEKVLNLTETGEDQRETEIMMINQSIIQFVYGAVIHQWK